MRLSRLGCVMCFFYVLGLFSSPLGAPKVPLRTPANDHFLPRLSSDLGGVLLFRIHCQEAAVLRLSRLGCVTFFVYVLRTGALFFSFRGSKGATSAPWDWSFFASPAVRFSWRLAVSCCGRVSVKSPASSFFFSSTMVLLPQTFLMVVVCVEAVRGLFDDPTCFGTCVSMEMVGQTAKSAWSQNIAWEAQW